MYGFIEARGIAFPVVWPWTFVFFLSSNAQRAHRACYLGAPCLDVDLPRVLHSYRFGVTMLVVTEATEED